MNGSNNSGLKMIDVNKYATKIFMALILVFSAYAMAQETMEETVETKKIPKKVVIKELTRAEKKIICNAYEGKYIAYYSGVFKVSKCKRIPLSSKEVYSLTKKKGKILQVGQKVVSALDVYEPEAYRSDKLTKKRCKELEGQYIVHIYGEVYYIENCIKRKFVYWNDFRNHRVSSKVKKKFFPVSWEEFSSIVEGDLMPERELVGTVEADVDVIPIDEACEGIDGKFVSYYSKIYKIEQCRKREVDLEWFRQEKVVHKSNMKEISSEQWLSIPDGIPILAKKHKNEKSR